MTQLVQAELKAVVQLVIYNSSGVAVKTLYGWFVRMEIYYVRKPLFNDGGNLKEMSTSQVDEIVQQAFINTAKSFSNIISC